MEQQDHNDDLNGAPLLRGLQKTDPFAVPEGFFEQFPARVQQRLVPSPRTPTAHQRIWDALFGKPIVIGALATLTLAVLVWYTWPSSQPVDQPYVASAVEPEELLLLDLDLDLVYRSFDGEDLMVAVTLPAEDATVLTYLENEDLPLDLLIEEL